MQLVTSSQQLPSWRGDSLSPRGRNPSYFSNVDKADRNNLVSALAGITVSVDGDWLDSSNVYAAGAGRRLRNDDMTVPASSISDFTEYLAAGVFVHCGDAWSYLGRALDALLRGDLHAAVHMTYYAELRGAMSLLWAEGIYVGDYYSCALDSNGDTVFISELGTHQAIWKCLDAWSGLTRSQSMIGMLIRPGGVALEEWLSSLPGGSGSPFVSNLLARMKFDLESFSDDRIRRNAASYNPSRIKPEDLDAAVIKRIIRNIWSALEPDAKGTFPVLDRLLLRDVLISDYGSKHKFLDADGEPTDDTDWSRWASWLRNAVPTQIYGTSLYEELLSASSESDSHSFLAAAYREQSTSQGPRAYVEGMLLRTTVLLRLATGASLALLKDSGLDDADIVPWAESLSEVRGLWPMNEGPDDKLDLWADTEVALEALGDDDSVDVHGLLAKVAQHIPTLGQAERVVAWNFA